MVKKPEVMDRIITLTTDFGLKDPYQGAMKGAVLSINPRAAIVDITHSITPGNVLEGAFVLLGACSFYPKGTIHVGVVDPGVGGARRPILVETQDYFFIGPDNGLFSLVLKKEKVVRTVLLNNSRYFRSEVSNTFHGRDIFGPVAAHLSLGVEVLAFGDEVEESPLTIEIPETQKDNSSIKGEIIYIDTFGNLITNIKVDDLDYYEAGAVEVAFKGKRIKGLKPTYSSVGSGEPLALISSSRYLEIAVNSGDAAGFFKARLGDPVRLKGRKKAD